MSQRKWYLANRGKVLARLKEYYTANREKILSKQRDRYRNSSYAKAYRELNAEVLKEKAKVYQKKRQEERRELIAKWKEEPCHDCGDYRPKAMQFDHVPERGPKLFSICGRVALSCSYRKLMAERAKCDMVCASCHQERSVERGQFKQSKTARVTLPPPQTPPQMSLL